MRKGDYLLTIEYEYPLERGNATLSVTSDWGAQQWLSVELPEGKSSCEVLLSLPENILLGEFTVASASDNPVRLYNINVSKI
jgi:hypothetical protein